jgi:hypothetical protein
LGWLFGWLFGGWNFGEITHGHIVVMRVSPFWLIGQWNIWEVGGFGDVDIEFVNWHVYYNNILLYLG